MEMSQGIAILNKNVICFSFTKSEKGRTAVSGGGEVGTSGKEEDVGKGVGG
jgi:hypothetical protein